MRTFVKILGIYSMMIIAVSCSTTEDPTEPTGTQEPNTQEPNTQEPNTDDFVGSWTAEKALFEIDFDGTIETADLIEEGVTINMVIEQDGKFSIEFVMGEDSETITGQMTRDNTNLTVVFDYAPNETSNFEIQVTDTNLLIDGGPLAYDFDNNGTTEPAMVSFIFVMN